jgi:hypothetical protein
MARSQTAENAEAPSAPDGCPGERELLFLCARMQLDADSRARVGTLLERPVDWDFLHRTAHRHSVLPLVHRTLGGFPTGPDSSRALDRMHQAVSRIAQRNLHLTAELLRVLDMFGAQGIPVIPYKGPVLAAWLYGDLSLRQYADLDVIVPVADAGRAAALLVADGYSEVTRTAKDVGLAHGARQSRVELHWGVTTAHSPIQIRPEWLWRNLGSFVLSGRTVSVHAPEDLLLILTIHGSKHCWERLGWLCDVAEIVRSRALDWDALIEEATRLGGRRILFLSLFLANELLGAPLPARIRAAVDADPLVPSLSREVIGWLHEPPGETAMMGARQRYFIGLRERRTDRIRIAVNQARKLLALSDRDREALPLPAFLSPVLYLIRPVRLVRAYGWGAIRRLFGGPFES